MDKRNKRTFLNVDCFDVVELGMNKLSALETEFTEVSSLEHLCWGI
jgi:hypothetical protein